MTTSEKKRPAKKARLSASAERLRQRIIRELELEDSIALALCEQFVWCWQACQDARALLAAESSVCQDRYGRPKPHPALEIARQAANSMLRIAKQLGAAGSSQLGRPPASGGKKVPRSKNALDGAMFPAIDSGPRLKRMDTPPLPEDA